MKFIVIYERTDRLEEGGHKSGIEKWTWEARWDSGGIAFCPKISESQGHFSTIAKCLAGAKKVARGSDFIEEKTGDSFSKAIERWRKK
jgi:hypothetical protein